MRSLTGPALEDARRSALAAVAVDEVARAVLFARVMRNRAEVERLWGWEPDSFPELELAGTARIGQIRAGGQLSDARRLVNVLTGTLTLLEAGVMFQPTAEVLLHLTRNCTDEVTAEVERRVLTRLATWGTVAARRLVAAVIPEVEADLDPALTQQRLDAARRNRGVWITPADEGMCEVGASLDSLVGRRWSLDFEELVRAQRVLDQRDGRKRTPSQRRADVFAELPGRLLALIQAIQQGRLQELLALSRLDPAAADSLRDLAASTAALAPCRPSVEESGPVPVVSPRPAPTPAASPPPGPPQQRVEQDSERGWADDREGFGAWGDAPSPGDLQDGPPQEPPPPLPDTYEHAQDVLLLACLRAPVCNPRVLEVHIPVTTLLELDHRTGWVEGVGAVPAQLSRMLLPVAGLRRVFVDARHGVPLGCEESVLPPLVNNDDRDPAATCAVAEQVRERLLGLLGPAVVTDTAQAHHDPTGTLGRFVMLRDRQCVGIGCARRASACDLDHEQRWPEGPTAAWNLSSKSRRCHRAKHSGWDVERTDTGDTRWTSPLGHHYDSPGVWLAPPDVPEVVTLPPVADLSASDAGAAVELVPVELPLWPT